MNILEEFSEDSADESKNNNDEANYFISYEISTNNNEEKKIILDKDIEPIYTLCKSTEIQYNKKIQFIKQMFNYLLKDNFTFTENLIIHSIYNHNVKCLLIRNKTFKEFVLIIIILNKFNIRFTKILIKNIFQDIPINEYSKKFIKIKNEINENFEFSDYIKNFKLYEIENDSNKILPKLIKQHVNGFIFYLKNQIIIPCNYVNIIEYNCNKITVENIQELSNIIIKNKNSIFCNDENLQIISSWLTNILKNIMIFNIYAIKNNYTQIINIHKSFDSQIHILINIFIYIIIIYNNNAILDKCKYKKHKIKRFLCVNYNCKVIHDVINNKTLPLVLKYIHETKLKKNMFSSRKYFKMIYQHLI